MGLAVAFSFALSGGCTEGVEPSEAGGAIEITDGPFDDGTPACTLIGCLDGIRIELVGPAASDAFTGAIDLGTDRIELTCPQVSSSSFDYSCGDRSVLVFAPSSLAGARLSIATDRGAMEDDVKLTFEPVYPNGQACGAVCEQALARVTLE